MSLRTSVGPDDHVEGPDNAPVTLVEYGDYQCPYCGEAYPEVKRVQRRFGDRLRFVFRNFPLTEMHPEALNAANVAEYCGSQGQFWAAHDALYEHQDELGMEFYEQLASSLGLSASDMRRAVEDNEFGERIEGDLESGLRSGVNGTPSFFLNGEHVQLESFGELADAVQQKLDSLGD